MKLTLGGTYKNNNGDIIEIVYMDPNKTKDGFTVYVDTMSRSYLEDGKYFYGWKPFDLIEICEGEP